MVNGENSQVIGAGRFGVGLLFGSQTRLSPLHLDPPPRTAREPTAQPERDSYDCSTAPTTTTPEPANLEILLTSEESAVPDCRSLLLLPLPPIVLAPDSLRLPLLPHHQEAPRLR